MSRFVSRMNTVAAIVFLLANPASAEEYILTGTNLAITVPDHCTIDPTNEHECRDQDGLYLTFHAHVEPGRNAKERKILVQSKLAEIARGPRSQHFKRAFEKDRARPEMRGALLAGGVVDPDPFIDIKPVGYNVWTFVGAWGGTSSKNVPLIMEKLEIWDEGKRVILDFIVVRHDDHIETLGDIVRSLRFR